jgi:imidazolonepropionase-like amidohydrolase
MNRRFLFLSFVPFFLLFLFAFQRIEISALSTPNIALINGTLIDGTGGPLLFKAVVIIEKGLISDIGEQNKVRIPADATIIDLKGSTLLPGFINAHVHHGYSNFNLKAWAKSGVTTVRDLGIIYSLFVMQQ